LSSVFVIHVLQGCETEIDELDGRINILLLNQVSKLELGHGLRNSDDSQQSSWGDVGVTQIFVSISLELSLLNVSGNDVVVELSWDCGVESLGISDERPHGFSINFVGVLLNKSKLLMDPCDMLCQFQILFGLSSVQKKEDDIESRKQSSWKVDVLMWLQFLVVSSINWVCCSQD